MSFQISTECEDILRDKWLIIDADALISIVAYKVEDVLDKLKAIGAKFVYIHPVHLELMSTDNPKEKLHRNSLLDNYNFVMLSLTPAEIDLATRIQESKPINAKSAPSATDLYLGGTLARYSQALLLTSNTKDFPAPVFTREAFITIFNHVDVKTISVIGVDKSQLISL